MDEDGDFVAPTSRSETSSEGVEEPTNDAGEDDGPTEEQQLWWFRQQQKKAEAKEALEKQAAKAKAEAEAKKAEAEAKKAAKAEVETRAKATKRSAAKAKAEAEVAEAEAEAKKAEKAEKKAAKAEKKASKAEEAEAESGHFAAPPAPALEADPESAPAEEEEVAYYEYETVDPEQKERERKEAAAEAAAAAAKTARRVERERRASEKRASASTSTTSTETVGGVTYDVISEPANPKGSEDSSHEKKRAPSRAKAPPPPTLYPSPPPPEPPDYSDVYEAASLAMNQGVGVHNAGDAQMKLIANEILLMEDELNVNKFNRLFEAYSQPGDTGGLAAGGLAALGDARSLGGPSPRRAGPFDAGVRARRDEWAKRAARLWAQNRARSDARAEDMALVTAAAGRGPGARAARERLAKQLGVEYAR